MSKHIIDLGEDKRVMAVEVSAATFETFTELDVLVRKLSFLASRVCDVANGLYPTAMKAGDDLFVAERALMVRMSADEVRRMVDDLDGRIPDLKIETPRPVEKCA